MPAKSHRSDDAVLALSALLQEFTIKDLSHTLREGIPTFPTHSKYYHLAWNQPGDPATMYQILMHEHNGTHVDAPAHYIAQELDPEKHYMHQVRIDALIAPASLVDLSDNPPSSVKAQMIEKWEKEHRPIGRGEVVIFNFGWHRKWNLSDTNHSFIDSWPGLDRSGAQYLLESGVKAVGTDCLGLDQSGSVEIPAHDTLLANDVLIIENLANLGGLPSRFFFFATPLKILEGSGSPIRALAFVPSAELEAASSD
jgi:kynurenine formamidase